MNASVSSSKLLQISMQQNRSQIRTDENVPRETNINKTELYPLSPVPAAKQNNPPLKFRRRFETLAEIFPFPRIQTIM